MKTGIVGFLKIFAQLIGISTPPPSKTSAKVEQRQIPPTQKPADLKREPRENSKAK